MGTYFYNFFKRNFYHFNLLSSNFAKIDLISRLFVEFVLIFCNLVKLKNLGRISPKISQILNISIYYLAVLFQFDLISHNSQNYLFST